MDRQEKDFIVNLAQLTYDRVFEEAVKQYRQVRQQADELQRLRSIEAAARFVDKYRDCFQGGYTPGRSDTDDACDVSLRMLHEALGQGQAGERGGSGA